MFVWWEVWLTLNKLKPMTWQPSTTSVRAEHMCLDGGAGWGKKALNQHFAPAELRPWAPGESDFIYVWFLSRGHTLSDTAFDGLTHVGGSPWLGGMWDWALPPQIPTAGSVPLCIVGLPQIWSRAGSHHWLLLPPGCTAVGPQLCLLSPCALYGRPLVQTAAEL